ncbi:MAG: hypothetical protein Q9180_005095, partial [Flavoplaca navasiana]
ILTDIGVVDHRFDAGGLEKLGVADAGQFQHLRRFYHAAGYDDFSGGICYEALVSGSENLAR